MNKLIKPIAAMPVVRDENGYWTHPEVDALLDLDFFVELNNRGMDCFVSFLDYDDEDLPAWCRYFEEGSPDIHDWDPYKPIPWSDGWFIASIHDTEDGPACLWLRYLGENSDEND